MRGSSVGLQWAHSQMWGWLGCWPTYVAWAGVTRGLGSAPCVPHLPTASPRHVLLAGAEMQECRYTRARPLGALTQNLRTVTVLHLVAKAGHKASPDSRSGEGDATSSVRKSTKPYDEGCGSGRGRNSVTHATQNEWWLNSVFRSEFYAHLGFEHFP